MIKFNKPEDLKTARRFLAGVLGAVLIYFAGVYFFVFTPTFTRCDDVRSVEHEHEFYKTEENYNIHLADVKWFEEQNCPLIEMTSFDGLKLKAYRLDAEKNARGTVLLMHGFHSGPVREFATIAKFLHSIDYNVVMPYQRSHGLSEGKYLTFGIKERYDCRDWLFKVNEIYGNELPLFAGGISMGCATVTMTAGFKELPSNLRGFIADCGFTSPGEIIYWTMHEKTGLPKALSNLLLMTGNGMANIFADFDFDDYSTFEALSECERPFLFITGTEDNTVPANMSRKNYFVYSMKNPDLASLEEFDATPHAISYLTDSQKYNRILQEFLKKYGAK